MNSRGCGTVFDVAEKKKKIIELEKESEKENLWDNREQASLVMQKLEELRKEVEEFESLQKDVTDLTELAVLMEDDIDGNGTLKENEDNKNKATDVNEAERELLKQLNDLKERVEKMELKTLFDGEYDNNDVIMTIRAGAGGTDAQDWAEMLLRMYLRWAEKNNFKVKILDKTPGSEAGIKSVTLEISGELAYGYLRSEAGTHRLVRLSPFNADNLRQTSFAVVEILPVVENSTEVEIKESDLRVDTFRSSGAGGQSVNTTDSAVRITHTPSGIVVTCQNERSQLQNKETALKILRAKLQQQKIEEQKQKEAELRGERSSAEWGSQIRSYVLHPYKMVKDHRTDYEESDVEKVLDGDINDFIFAFLKNPNLNLK
ncbi:MAG TPA: peptide chain release factor 2 [Candidatus Moranbacteria bacterium]|nr:peptide chain release factor 2 [Candidatus Moranbacteria bacterium]